MAALKYENLNSEEALNLLYQKNFINDNYDGFLTTLINDNIITDANMNFWTEAFTLAPTEEQINLGNTKANPAYTVTEVKHRPVPMAEAMAPLSEVSQLDQEGFESRQGEIYQYGKGLFDTSLSKMELEQRLLALSVQQRSIIDGFVAGVADLIKSHNYNLSNLAAQALSQGGAYNNGTRRGLSGVAVSHGVDVPSTSFLKAGAKVWSTSTGASTDADIPSYIQSKLDKFKKDNNIADNVPFMMDVPYDMIMNIFLKNYYVREEVNRYIRLYAPDKVFVIKSDGTSAVDTSFVTWEQLVLYSQSAISKIPVIHVVKESQINQGITSSTTVHGWKSNVVVLRPVGYAGVIVHSNLADVELLNREANSTIDFNIGKYNGYLYVINKIAPYGSFKQYHTDVLGRYAPALTVFNEMAIIDTETAD
jgi:hypothetical protein